MNLGRWTTALFCFGLMVPTAGLPGEPAGDFLATVNVALEEGRISQSEAFLNTFYYVFDPAMVRPDLAVDESKPLKCLSQIVSDFEESKEDLDPTTVAIIEGYLNESPAYKVAATYISPSGIFQLTYVTTGSNAVPSDDVNPPNGIPDYVERVGEYADSCWSGEVDHMGFIAPNLTNGFYPVSFLNMGAYGYAVSTGGGRSYIVLENDFLGFPANQDPDGNQLGAAKATMAHEFKHATQFNTGDFGGWAEGDATWIEDMIYDETNDYYNYLASGNSIVDPATPLDDGGGASYEDCIWQHFLEENYSGGTCQIFAQRRRDFPTEHVTKSYAEATFAQGGTGFAEAYTHFAAWNYLIGTFATTTLPGYEEAAVFPIVLPGTYANLTSSSYPYSNSDAVPNMATHVFKCKGMTSLSGNIRIEFTGDPTKVQSVVALLKVKTEFGGGWEREDVPLDGNNNADYTVGRPASELGQVAVLVINPKRIGANANYDITISDGVATSVGSDLPTRVSFGLGQNRPNPFNPTTSISFDLPKQASTTLVIYNPAGRIVRTLVGGLELSTGTHTYVWDGRDDRGSEVGSGVYHYQLVSENFSDTRRMILIR